jgi:hypothetical protein
MKRGSSRQKVNPPNTTTSTAVTTGIADGRDGADATSDRRLQRNTPVPSKFPHGNRQEEGDNGPARSAFDDRFGLAVVSWRLLSSFMLRKRIAAGA